MAMAIMLVNADPGKDRAVARALKRVRGVKGVCLVSGLYDVVATVRAGTSESRSWRPSTTRSGGFQASVAAIPCSVSKYERGKQTDFPLTILGASSILSPVLSTERNRLLRVSGGFEWSGIWHWKWSG